MSTITIYSDETCTVAIGSGFVGEYVRIAGRQPTINTYSQTRTIDEKTVVFHQIQQFLDSTTRVTDEPTIFEIHPTETKVIQEFYFTPNCRYRFYLWGTAHNLIFESAGFQTRFTDSGNFENVTQIASNQYSFYDIAGLMFRTGKNAHYDGNTILGDFFGIDVIAIDGQGHNVPYRCMHACSPWDLVRRDGEYKPYKPATGNRVKSGTGTGYYPNNPIPALPTNAINAAFASVLGTGNGLTYYRLDGDCLEKITEFLYDTTLTLKFRNSAFRDCIASVVYIPYNVTADVTNTLRTIYLANKPIYPQSACDFIKRPLREIDFGIIDLTAANVGYKTFADVTQTTATLYLPAYGAVNIDLSSFAGGILHLRGVIDVRNGNILYRLESQADLDETPVLYGQYTGNCGIPVPIGGANASPTILGAIASIGTVATGVATGNPLSVVGGISSFAQQTAPTVDKSGAMQPAAAGYGTPVPILQIQKHIMLAPPKFTELRGKLSAGMDNETQYKLSDFTGFFQAAAVDVSGINGATDSEKAEIESILKGGVYL